MISKRALVLAVLTACGSSKPAPVTGSTGAAGPTAAPPVIPAAWADLAPGEVAADLDADGTPERIAVGGEGDQRTVAIDGAPYTCGASKLTEFGAVSLVDINPALPGLELVVGQHMGDDDWEYCYVYKASGALQALELGNSQIDGTLVLVDGDCSAEPTIYERVASGFTERADLVASHELATRCCEGPDCP